MSKPLRVLLVEDSEDDALLLIRKLKKSGYEPEYERVETAEATQTALSEKIWDVILCDYNLPRFNGLGALKLYKESGIDIPFIIVSGAIGEEMAVECMRLGARDYVMKGNLSRLASAVERELKEAESRVQRKRAEEELQRTLESLRKAVSTTIQVMVSAVESRDPYPRHLKGDDILMEARIMAVADVVEAMASHRPYRPGLGINVALEEIEKNKETLYDADVADTCSRLFREKGFKLGGT